MQIQARAYLQPGAAAGRFGRLGSAEGRAVSSHNTHGGKRVSLACRASETPGRLRGRIPATEAPGRSDEGTLAPPLAEPPRSSGGCRCSSSEESGAGPDGAQGRPRRPSLALAPTNSATYCGVQNLGTRAVTENFPSPTSFTSPSTRGPIFLGPAAGRGAVSCPRVEIL